MHEITSRDLSNLNIEVERDEDRDLNIYRVTVGDREFWSHDVSLLQQYFLSLYLWLKNIR